LYTQVEQIDKTFLRQHFSDPNGNLYKPEMPAAYLNWTEVDLERQQANMGIVWEDDSELTGQINMGGGKLVDILKVLEEQKEKGASALVPDVTKANAPARQPRDYLQQMGLKTNEGYFNHSALLHFLNVLNNEPDDTFPAEIVKVLDVDGTLRFLAVSVLVGYYDSYLGMGHNYYLYEVDGKFTILPWDLNGAFATFTGGMSRQNIINLYIDEPTCGPIADRPLINRLLSYKPYLDTYHGYLKDLLEGPFSVEVMDSRINELANLIHPYVAADELKFYSTADFKRSLSEDIMRTGSGGIKPLFGTLPPLPKLSTGGLACLRSKFDKGTLDELLTRRPTPEELNKLKSCLTREEVLALLQRGQNLGEQPMKLGPTFIGLKTYVVERSTSVWQQLQGKRPSAGDGSGNGGNMRMLGVKSGIPGMPPPRR
jgi:hypothetical protein